MNSVKVLLVLPDGSEARGGIQRMALYLMREMASISPDIRIIEQRSRDARWGKLKHITTGLLIFQIIFRLIFIRPDIVHMNVAPRGSTFRKMSLASLVHVFKTPLILHLHGSGYHEFYASLSPRKRAMVRRFFQRATHVVVLGQFWYDFASNELGVAGDRLSTIGNGVPAAEPAEPTTPTPVFAYMGLVGTRKGVDVLLDAFAELNRGGVDFHAQLGGNGEVETYRARAAELGLSDKVQFLGWIDEAGVDCILRAASVFVLPSRAENQPVAILEAMARGLPVVATDVGAIPETIVDRETGLIVPAGDASALASALRTLAQDPGRRRIMGSAGCARWRELYSITASAKRFSELYRRLSGSERRSKSPSQIMPTGIL